VQADEFVAEVEGGTVGALLQRAAAAHPTCTLALLIEGLHHYLQQRERSEFRCTPPPVSRITPVCTCQSMVPLLHPATAQVVTTPPHLCCEDVRSIGRLGATKVLMYKVSCDVRRAAGGPGAGTTFNCRPTQQAVMQLVTRYPGVRHRIVHDAAQVQTP
jgi:hypothetical protein